MEGKSAVKLTRVFELLRLELETGGKLPTDKKLRAWIKHWKDAAALEASPFAESLAADRRDAKNKREAARSDSAAKVPTRKRASSGLLPAEPAARKRAKTAAVDAAKAAPKGPVDVAPYGGPPPVTDDEYSASPEGEQWAEEHKKRTDKQRTMLRCMECSATRSRPDIEKHIRAAGPGVEGIIWCPYAEYYYKDERRRVTYAEYCEEAWKDGKAKAQARRSAHIEAYKSTPAARVHDDFVFFQTVSRQTEEHRMSFVKLYSKVSACKRARRFLYQTFLIPAPVALEVRNCLRIPFWFPFAARHFSVCLRCFQWYFML